MSMKTNGKHKSSHEIRKLKQWFGNLPVVEAKRELRIQPSLRDIRGAVKQDPERCVFSRACRRQLGANTAVFFRTRAYVDLLDEDGKRHIERFNISKDGTKL